MALNLARLPSGRLGKWFVLVLWLAIAAGLGPLASKLTEVQKNDNAAWLPRSAEATEAYERALAHFPDTGTIPAVIVYVRDGGLSDADRARATADREALAPLAKDGEVSPLIPSADGAALLYALPLDGTLGWEGLPATVQQIRDRMADAPAGLRTGVAGPAAVGADFSESFAGIDTTLLLVTGIVVAVILLITYRSPVLWIIPLLSVGVALSIAQAVIYLLAKYADLTVNGQGAGILTVLVFGAGTDYALLLVARYREELKRHANRHEAMGIALRHCFPAILASGTTVILSMLCLLAAQMNNIRGLGPVAAIGIAVALLVMTTLLPALLVILGRWVFWPFTPRFDPAAVGHDASEDHGIWGRIAGFVGRRSRPIWILTTVALIGISLGSLTLKTGLTYSESFTKEVGSVAAEKLLNAHFAGGSSAPAQIYAVPAKAAEVAAAASKAPGVASVGAAQAAPDGQWVVMDAVLRDAPDTPEAQEAVRRLRDAVHAVPGAQALVGGQTATQVDMNAATDHDNKLVMPLILLVVFVVLMLLLRAVVAPLLLIASVVLSFLAAMGAAALLFAALGHSHVDQGFVLLGFLFLVALGVDYTIFLMSRAREETAKVGHREGILRALAVTGGVITSAGIVLAATFTVLAVLPLVTLLQMGLIVAVGVLLDTLVVRTLLVPALSLDAGRKIWWPSRRAAQVRTPQRAPELPQVSRL